MNNVILMGRLVADPEMRTVSEDVNCCNFTLAVNRRYKKDQADFIPCTAWRNTADIVHKYFRKGDMLALDGSIMVNSYEVNGSKRYKTIVNADNIYFTGSKTATESTKQLNQVNGANNNKSQPQANFDDFTPNELPDDLPF